MAAASAFAFILAMMLLGRLLAWRGVLPADAPNALNMVVLYVCLPAAILLHAPALSFEPTLMRLIAVPWLILLVGALLVLGLAKLLKLGRPQTAALLLLVTLGNTSFLGFALIPALAGEGALRYAVLYDQLGSFIQLSTFGLLVLALYGGDERPTVPRVDGGSDRGLAGPTRTVWAILRRVLSFPPFLVLVLALTVMPERYPAVIQAALERLEGALLPLVAIAIGIQLRFAMPREQLVPLAIGLVTKLVLMPALALGLCFALGITGDMRAAALLETAMPPMITAAALLATAKLAPELAAALVGWGVVLSMLTLPVWTWVLSVL